MSALHSSIAELITARYAAEQRADFFRLLAQQAIHRLHDVEKARRFVRRDNYDLRDELDRLRGTRRHAGRSTRRAT